MTIFLLYLWLKLDSFIATIGFVTFLLIAVPAVVLIVCATVIGEPYTSREKRTLWIERRARCFKKAKISWAIAVVFFTTWVALPTQKEGAYLIAGYAGLKLAETPEMGKLTELVRLKVGNYLDEELKNAKADAMKAAASAVK